MRAGVPESGPELSRRPRALSRRRPPCTVPPTPGTVPADPRPYYWRGIPLDLAIPNARAPRRTTLHP